MWRIASPKEFCKKTGAGCESSGSNESGEAVNGNAGSGNLREHGPKFIASVAVNSEPLGRGRL